MDNKMKNGTFTKTGSFEKTRPEGKMEIITGSMWPLVTIMTTIKI